MDCFYNSLYLSLNNYIEDDVNLAVFQRVSVLDTLVAMGRATRDAKVLIALLKTSACLKYGHPEHQSLCAEILRDVPRPLPEGVYPHCDDYFLLK